MKLNCPTCGGTTTWEENPNRPFCSERCRVNDLGKWASDQYRIAGTEPAGTGSEETENDDTG